MIAPPIWSSEQFERDRRVAIERFRIARMQESLEDYLSQFEYYRSNMESLLEMTVDLAQLKDQAVEIVSDPNFFDALRYMAGPPISADDLKTLVDTNSVAPTRVSEDPELAIQIIETIFLGLDRQRFPWVSEDREPTEQERVVAAVASAALQTSRKIMTVRANDAREEQEESVVIGLQASGMTIVPTREIRTLVDAPAPGCFCRESLFGGRKADVIVRLWDGRVMPIECKVSNSATNSVKRLNNDAAAKAEKWLREFGEAQTIPTAVLSGVFNLHNLIAAQASRLTIFWAHNLESLIGFVNATRS